MKLRIYFKPGWLVFFLALAAGLLLAGVGLLHGWWRWPVLALAGFYSALGLLAAFAWWRLQRVEKWVVWNKPERLLILAPHQDDCVICAGGMGIRNQQLGGATHVVYLVQDEIPGMAERRTAEAVAAWQRAGVPAGNLRHLNVFPPLYERNPHRFREAAAVLQQIVDAIVPTVLVVPAFEGGHIHHDLLNHLSTRMLKLPPGIRVLECPEYSPYLSLRRTPHRVISLCGRWLGGLVAYYGPPDGVDNRPIYKLEMTAAEMETKRKMYVAFESQHGDSLARTRAYPDRFMEWQTRPFQPCPFPVAGSYSECARNLERWLPRRWILKILPGNVGTIGREPNITNLSEE